jgi:hypothetical protein
MLKWKTQNKLIIRQSCVEVALVKVYNFLSNNLVVGMGVGGMALGMQLLLLEHVSSMK